MGSGEGDAIREVVVNNNSVTTPTPKYNTYTGTGSSISIGGNTWPNNTYWYYPTTTVYLYQIKCPASKCRKMNWLEIDKIKPCVGCGARLKAVSEQADFEVAVDR